MREKNLIFTAILLAAALLAIICILANLLISQPTGMATKQIKQLENNLEKGNGIVTNIWIEEKRIRNLENHGIKYLIVDVGDTAENGELKTPKEEIKKFIEVIKDYEKKEDYDFILLPYSEINTYRYNINSEFEKNFLACYSALIRLGFDGIFVDIEPVKIGQESNYLSILEKLEKISGEKILAVYSGTVFEGDARENEWEWPLELYKNVSDRVDLIIIPGYDFGFDNKEDYQAYIKNQIKILSSDELDSNLMLAVPTHKQEPETIQNALEAYQEADSSRFLGLGIFAEWTTDETEWKTMSKNIF